MITLSVADGKPFVWNAEDWLKLREEHHIVGVLVGCLAHLPRQEAFPGLPMMLLPEEATLLLEKKLVQLARFPSLSRAPGPGVKEEFEKYRKRIYEEQKECFMAERKRQVTNMLDQIIEGKRRKLLGLKTLKKKEARKAGKIASDQKELCSSPAEVERMTNREALLEEELQKIAPIHFSNTLVQTFTAYPWLRSEDACNVRWQFPSNPAEKLRYMTFKDIWEKGFYLTSGQKFGGDFLAYPGDPVKFHAQFLVVCIQKDSPITPAQLVAYGRLGTSVRKTVLLASLSTKGEKVIYQSLKWNGTL
ncbi:tRNA-splicing endonuclease subunit Sen34 [Anabrus simplex]|uniref:tRNA-splicing endonuclease subunit Sen34 n=1 Tax=Anabrus simplex TaxID=316456 RepID=UPI0035A26475